MSRTSRIHVVVVDDHPVVRFGLAALIKLQGDMTLVGDVGSGEEACMLCEQRDVDVVLMDLRLPGMSGVEAIRAIRERRPITRLIVLTTYDGDGDIRRALDAGACAYLLKAMNHCEVTSAIRKVHAGHRVIPEEVSRTLADVYPQSQLSPREIEVLELIASGLSNREIGATLGVTEATVKWYVNIILRRLDVGDRTEAIVVASRRGLIQLR
jgi:DNA-binding NarL/FixJ family response regulator